METASLAPLALYSFVCTATPGPNNIMLASSGLAFGMRRTVPHVLGISAGCAILLIMCGLGLGAVFETWPILRWALRITGALYLLWLAVKLWWSTIVSGGGAVRPLSLLEAAGFQFINPKAWAITLPAIATFTVSGRPLTMQLATIVVVFVVIAIPANAVWVAMGVGARGLLESPRAMALFVRIMAALTALTALLFLI